MSSAFFIYDLNGNIQLATTNFPNVTPPSQLLVLDSGDVDAQRALAQPSNYIVQDGELVQATTITIDRTRTFSGAWETDTLTFATSDQSIKSIEVSFLNQKIELTTDKNGIATLDIDLHVSLQNECINIGVSGSGIVSNSTFIGGNGSVTTLLQTFVDPNGSGPVKIAPVSKSFLSNYWTSKAVNASYSTADISTWLSVLMQTVYGVILPKLIEGTTPVVTLDANQQNALSDITTNVLPNLITTLEEAAPVPAEGAAQTYDLHYQHAVATFAATKQAIESYVSDLETIPNLV